MAGKTGHSGRPNLPEFKRKDNKITTRLTDDELQMLDVYCDVNSINRTEAVRQGIMLLLSKRRTNT